MYVRAEVLNTDYDSEKRSKKTNRYNTYADKSIFVSGLYGI